MVITFGSGRKRAGVEQGASPHFGQLCRPANSVIWRRLNCLGHDAPLGSTSVAGVRETTTSH
jgi:hypothetical protein